MHNTWVIMAIILAIIEKGDHTLLYALPLQLIVHIYLWNTNGDNTLHNKGCLIYCNTGGNIS